MCSFERMQVHHVDSEGDPVRHQTAGRFGARACAVAQTDNDVPMLLKRSGKVMLEESVSSGDSNLWYVPEE